MICTLVSLSSTARRLTSSSVTSFWSDLSRRAPSSAMWRITSVTVGFSLGLLGITLLLSPTTRITKPLGLSSHQEPRKSCQVVVVPGKLLFSG
ncbi:60S ribosomal protein l8-3 [Phtheirospermum japonicum]|uniref:60S ribosomal protein l8-3 n=1 Tax=Phtheirospermum japonicum TaxID=374723 RepID=A0A830CI78_9LAMI|nr:60S ribosomal protein l8-3 [Phtheirospermum japonicum]